MIKTVAVHEFLSTIKRKAYYLVTLGMPVILLAYAGLVALITYAAVPDEMKKLGKPIGIVDASGILTGPQGELHDLAPGETYEVLISVDDLERMRNLGPVDLEHFDLPMLKRQLRRFDELSVSHEALLADELSSVVRILADYVQSGRLEQYERERRLMGGASIGFLHRMLNDNILRLSGVPPETIARIQEDPTITEYELGAGGDFVEVDLWRKGFEMGIPMGVAVLLLIALMMNSSLLLASVAEEKESKVMEVILSSVRADQLLFGKVLGLSTEEAEKTTETMAGIFESVQPIPRAGMPDDIANFIGPARVVIPVLLSGAGRQISGRGP